MAVTVLIFYPHDAADCIVFMQGNASLQDIQRIICIVDITISSLQYVMEVVNIYDMASVQWRSCTPTTNIFCDLNMYLASISAHWYVQVQEYT